MKLQESHYAGLGDKTVKINGRWYKRIKDYEGGNWASGKEAQKKAYAYAKTHKGTKVRKVHNTYIWCIYEKQ